MALTLRFGGAIPPAFSDGIETVPRRYAVCYRNRWMIRRSDYVITHVSSPVGSGAAKFKDLAEKQGKTVNRAAYYNEYRYWRRELRCLYLCLIPFVTERNAMKIYRIFFHKPKHAEKRNRNDSIMSVLAMSVISIAVCAVCLCGASRAWFTASTSTGTTAIQSSSYKLSYQIGSDTAELAEVKTVAVPESGNCKITLSAGGTSGATGCCSVKIGDETYYTEQIFANGTFTFTVNAAAGTTITLTPNWGTNSHDATLHNDDFITATGSQQSNIQAPDNSVTAKPTAEPTAPTTPTTPTTPSSTPAESATTAPEPSATAPTEPETTDTEPTPAP